MQTFPQMPRFFAQRPQSLGSLCRPAFRLCFVMLALFLSACGDETGTRTPSADDKSAQTAERAETANTGAGESGEKVNVYVSCYNKIDKSTYSSINRYFSWIKNPEAGPTGQENVVYGLYPLNADEAAQCQERFAEAARQKPALEQLDAAGKNYADAVVALNVSVAAIYPYYDREDYKDDGFAKGKATHAALLKDMRAFMAASETFSRLLDEENSKVLVRQLAEVEKMEGRKSRYWRMSVMMEAKQVADLMSEEDFPVDAATKRLTAFEKAADEAAVYAKEHKKELPPLWHMQEMATEDFRKAAKERLRRVRDKTPYTHGEQSTLSHPGSEWMVDGSPGKIIWTYNKLVENSNRL